ncbi:MAG TPA: response regulator FixJ, partial [Phenylobacterium sp.]
GGAGGGSVTAARLVHVIDDDAAVRDALDALLGSAGLEVRTYATAVDFLDRLAAAAPGCVVSDVQMPGVSGLELLHRLEDRRGEFPMIVLTGQADVPMAVEALQAGAADFIEKPFDSDRIIRSVQAALARMSASSERSQEKGVYGQRAEALSPREAEVLDGLVAGLSTKAIARNLGLSPRTVDVYRGHVMSKMQAESLAELVRMVMIVRGAGG